MIVKKSVPQLAAQDYILSNDQASFRPQAQTTVRYRPHFSSRIQDEKKNPL